jgi:hypothetical protein
MHLLYLPNDTDATRRGEHTGREYVVAFRGPGGRRATSPVEGYLNTKESVELDAAPKDM